MINNKRKKIEDETSIVEKTMKCNYNDKPNNISKIIMNYDKKYEKIFVEFPYYNFNDKNEQILNDKKWNDFINIIKKNYTNKEEVFNVFNELKSNIKYYIDDIFKTFDEKELLNENGVFFVLFIFYYSILHNKLFIYHFILMNQFHI